MCVRRFQFTMGMFFSNSFGPRLVNDVVMNFLKFLRSNILPIMFVQQTVEYQFCLDQICKHKKVITVVHIYCK